MTARNTSLTLNRFGAAGPLCRFMLLLSVFFVLAIHPVRASAGIIVLDPQALLPEEQLLLERLAGAGLFEVYADWEQGLEPGITSGWYIVDGVEVTSIDGSMFTLYLIDEEGFDCIFDVEVTEDGSLMVYEEANHSAQFWSAVMLDEVEAASDAPQADANGYYLAPLDESRLAVVVIGTPLQPGDDSELFGEGGNGISDALDPRGQVFAEDESGLYHFEVVSLLDSTDDPVSSSRGQGQSAMDLRAELDAYTDRYYRGPRGQTLESSRTGEVAQGDAILTMLTDAGASLMWGQGTTALIAAKATWSSSVPALVTAGSGGAILGVVIGGSWVSYRVLSAAEIDRGYDWALDFVHGDEDRVRNAAADAWGELLYGDSETEAAYEAVTEQTGNESTPDPNSDNAPLDPDAQAVVDEFNALLANFSSGHATPHAWGGDNSGIQSGQNSTSSGEEGSGEPYGSQRKPVPGLLGPRKSIDGAKKAKPSPWVQAKIDAEEAFMAAKGRGMTPRQGGAINPGSGDDGADAGLGGTVLDDRTGDLSNGDPAGPDDDRGGIAD